MSMIEKRILGLAAISLAFSAIPAANAADEPLRLEPSTKWIVKYDDDSCRMARTFGSGDDKVSVLFSRTEPSDSFSLILTGKPVYARKNHKPLELKFGPDEAEQEAEFFPGSLGKDNPAAILKGTYRIAPITEDQRKLMEESTADGIPLTFRITPEQEAAANFIRIKSPYKDPIILETGSLGKPFAEMRKCTDELLASWGIDVEKHKNLTRAPIPRSNPGNWITPSDYPAEMKARGAQAVMSIRLNVDAEGLITDCHVQEATEGEAFQDATCKALTRRGRFQPALDAEGNAIASYFTSRVVFQMRR